MPSTYSPNLLLELMANGENDALWGDITNENLEIIGRAISGVSTLSLSGTTTTLTVSQGTASEGHYAVLQLGGSPSGTNTITITPNTVARVYFVKNDSGQTAVFSQGSGANATILNGKSGIVYSNGAGTGAAVTDITTGFNTGLLLASANLSDVADAAASLVNLGLTATAAEVNVLDGVTATTAELNILDGVTSTTEELNILDGVTATTAELNLLDGVTSTTAELNILDGVTATTAELNYVDGVTSAIQTQLDGKEAVDAEILKADTDDNLTAGYTATPTSDGTQASGTYTPTPAGGNFKTAVNGGAFTLAAPTATGSYTLIIQITNDASAGAVTFSGFNKTVGTSLLTTTNGDDFFIYITKVGGFTSASVEALQ